MSFLRNRSETHEHPKIKAFLEICDALKKGDFLHESEIFASNILSLAENLLILRWDERRQDFLYRLYGSRLTDAHGIELSGKYLSDAQHGLFEQEFVKAHRDAIQYRELVHIGGRLDWRNKDFCCWNEVIMPLQRDDGIEETLAFVTFD